MCEAMSIDALVAELDGKREGNSWRCECPVPGHTDGHHLIITEKKGMPLFHCKQDASQNDVLTALRERHLWPLNGMHTNGKNSTSEPRGLEAEYRYRNPHTREVLAIKKRYTTASGKTFVWYLPDAAEPGLGDLKQGDLPV